MDTEFKQWLACRCPLPVWLRRIGAGGFLFFLIKGLVWLVLPGILWAVAP